MTGTELFVLFALLVGIAMLIYRQSQRIAELESRAARHTEMLMALLQRSGINPVTLD